MEVFVLPSAGKLGVPFAYDETVLTLDDVEKLQANQLLNDFYVDWSGHFSNVDNNHAVDRTMDCHLLLFTTGGEGYLLHNDMRKMIMPGYALFIPGYVPHSYGNGRGGWSGYWAHFSGTISNQITQQYFGDQILLMDVGVNEVLTFVMSEIHNQMVLGKQMPNLLHAANALRYALSLVAKLWQSRSSEGAEQNMLENILKFMHQNLTRSIMLSEIANRVHLSESQLIRFFRKKTGFTPMEYYNTARMKEACMKMLHGETNINEISASLGFENQFYFSTQFRRTFGYSPSQFIRCMQKPSKR